tara:strand:+ start:5520 stop:6164 length:645 start_codon:yes stop_codon:yes gene_type:complete
MLKSHLSLVETEIASSKSSMSDKELCIIHAASLVFLEQGFNNANMAQIAKKAQVSKQTLYTNFGSKENLFDQVITYIFRDIKNTFEPPKKDCTPQEEFTYFIVNLLRPVFSKEGICLHRLAIAESYNNPKLSKIYLSRIERLISKISARISHLESIGLIKVNDNSQAAQDLIYSCKGITHTKLLCGYIDSVSADEIKYIAKKSVEKFFEIHKTS